MTTPNCEHNRLGRERPGTLWFCFDCRQRFVPADVLEGMKQLVHETRQCACEPGNSPCDECGERLDEALRQMDGLLGLAKAPKLEE